MTYAAHAVQPTQARPPAQAFEPVRITGTVKYEARKSWMVRGHAVPRSNVVLTTSEGDIQAWGDFEAINHLRKGNPVTAELDREGKSWSIVLPSQMNSGGNVVAIAPAPAQAQQPSAPQAAPIPQAQPATKSPAPASGGGYRGREKPAIDISKPGVYDAVIDLAAASMMDLKRKTADVSEESCQKLASTALIRFLDSATEDQLIQWAARNAKKDMGF